MSGICGVVHASPRPEAELDAELGAMLAALAHLGPDGQASYVRPGIALGQLLDRQTPEGAGATLPYTHVASGCVVVADVRLDNRAELASALGIDASTLATLCDEALLGEAYARWGSDCATRLLGDYCFAVWDPRKNTLVLIRDALGVRPCFYAQGDGWLAFGSELKALLALENVEWTPNERRIASYLSLDFEDLEETFYAGVRRLPPANVLEFELSSGAKQRQYWRLELGPVLVLRDKREYTDAFRSLLIDAVERRLRTTQKVGFLLSGGLDSSSIVGIASSLSSAPVNTFSALFPDYPEIDEKKWIDRVLARGAFEPHFVRADRGSPLGSIERELVDQGEPFFAPNCFIDSLLLDSAQNAGVRVIIDGLDGDTTVGHGWEFMGELLRKLKVRRLWRLAKALSEHTDKSASWFLLRHAILPTLFGLWRAAFPRVRPRITGLMSPELARRVASQLHGTIERAKTRVSPLADYRTLHHAKLMSGLIPACYEVAAKQAGARGAVRRHPYFDRRLVELCVSLPAEQRLDRGVDRIIQRRAVEGFVPDEIKRRLTKSIWVRNAKDRLRTDDRERIEALGTGSNRAELEPYISMKALNKIKKNCLSEHAEEKDLTSLWLVAALGIWLRYA